jgi:hypothetical protein
LAAATNPQALFFIILKYMRKNLDASALINMQGTVDKRGRCGSYKLGRLTDEPQRSSRAESCALRADK